MSAIKSIIGIKCPDCEQVHKTYRPEKAGIFRIVCPNCGRVILVKIPNLNGKEILTKDELVERIKQQKNQ